MHRTGRGGGGLVAPSSGSESKAQLGVVPRVASSCRAQNGVGGGALVVWGAWLWFGDKGNVPPLPHSVLPCGAGQRPSSSYAGQGRVRRSLLVPPLGRSINMMRRRHGAAVAGGMTHTQALTMNDGIVIDAMLILMKWS